jgi:predicted transcriptional regulator
LGKQNKVVVSFKLSDDEYQLLKRIAEVNNKTVSEVIRDALSIYLTPLKLRISNKR